MWRLTSDAHTVTYVTYLTKARDKSQTVHTSQTVNPGKTTESRADDVAWEGVLRLGFCQ